MMNPMLVICYRTGGTINFAWFETLRRYEDAESASEIMTKLERAGYPSVLVPENHLSLLPQLPYDVEDCHRVVSGLK